MTQANGSKLSTNANLQLRHLTLDDVIHRAAFNRGITDWNEEVRAKYGREIFGGEVVIVRSDLNSPVNILGDDQYELGGMDRIEASVPTIEELVGYGAKVVVIAHQGRLGQPDFIRLEPHHRVLEELLGRKIIFMRGHHYGENTQFTIKNMKEGDIFLLDNIRKMADNALASQDPVDFANAPDSYMKVIGRLAKYFINDAFSTPRWEGSILGFPYILNIAGRLTEKEVKENQELLKSIRPPYTLLLGGVKISDYLDSIENALEQKLVNNISAVGALGVMAATEQSVDGKRVNLGTNTSDFLRKEGIYRLMNRVRRLASRYPESFILPIDFKVEVNGEVTYMTPEEIHRHPNKNLMNIYGIGPRTVARFKEVLGQSKTVYIKGPPTKDNDERFLQESQELIDFIVRLKSQDVITILAGGNTHNLATKLGYPPKRDFSYATLAGSAAIEYQFGILPPGLLMLNTSYNVFNGHDLYRGLEGHRELGFELVPPRIPELLRPR